MSDSSFYLLPLFLFITSMLLIFLVIAIINTITFPKIKTGVNNKAAKRLRDQGLGHRISPAVSVLIPARNEAYSITRIIRSLASQVYPNFTVWILDDQSTDDTAKIVQDAIGDMPNFHLVAGKALPPGWLGKNYACHQLARLADGDYLLFLDADVELSDTAIRALVDTHQRLNAHLLTVWPSQITITWGERLVVPLMAMAILAYLPLVAVHHVPLSIFAAANGQCLLFDRRAYQKVGGHQAVRGSLIEDVSLARRIKKAGLNLRMADGGGLVLCRMYTGLADVVSGYAKNILAGHGNQPVLLLISTLFHLLIFIFPWCWLIAGLLTAEIHNLGQALWPAWPTGMITLGIVLRALTALVSRQRLQDSLLLPLSVLLMTLIAAKAIWWRFRQGGPIWKDRLISAGPGKSG